MSSSMSPAVQQYLAGRRAELLHLEQSGQESRPSHDNTIKNPHTCRHCQTVIVDLRRSDERIRLGYDIGEAVSAAQEGCPIYQRLVDIAAGGISSSSGHGHKKLFFDFHNLVFSYVFSVSDKSQFLSASTLRLLVHGQLDDKSEHLILGGGTASRPQYCWAHTGDNAASDITTRPFELDFASDTSVRFAKNCLEICRSGHSACRPPTHEDLNEPEFINESSIPSRLLEITRDKSVLRVRLIGKDSGNDVDKHLVSQKGYAILSYCWGGPQPVQLTTSSAGELSTGIPASLLPQTIQDAVWYTSAIDLRYLWVDALCIFQDDSHDKMMEITRMAQYYSESTVTLCAASASRCSEGFLQPRQDNPAAYSLGPIQLHCTTLSGKPGHFQAAEEYDPSNDYGADDGERPVEPSTLRGWTLQESLLSRRILIFSSARLIFTCTLSNATCGGPETTPTNRMMSSYMSPVAGIHTLSGLRNYPVLIIWERVVTEYTARRLGFPSDKLPAVSALASTITSMAKERRQNVVYLAGLMLDHEDSYEWRTQLLWMSCRFDATREAEARGPSWTWSSLDGPVMAWNWSRPLRWDGSDGTRLLEYKVRLRNSAAPFGEVSDGFIRVRARTRALGTIADHNVKLVRRRRWNAERHYPETAALLLCPDTADRELIISRALRSDQPVALLELIPVYARETSPAGLIVARSSGDADRYIRLGIFEYQTRDLTHVDHVEPDTEWTLRNSLFSGSSFRDITIT